MPALSFMEVIVDDTQLSLAIGKKGQNVRLAARLLGWKIDIKSEEEKRQEVESQMAALVGTGAPVSALMEYGLPEFLVTRLMDGGVTTVEALGNMATQKASFSQWNRRPQICSAQCWSQPLWNG